MKLKRQHYLENELYRLLSQEPAIFELLQSGLLDGLWYRDLEHPEREWMNARFWELLGYDPNAKRHPTRKWQDLIHPDDLQIALSNFRAHCADSRYPYDQIVRYRHASGSIVWVRCRGIAIRDISGKPIRMLGAHSDLTELKEKELRLQKQADELHRLVMRDELTGLYSRRAFHEQVERSICNARCKQACVSILLIDLDHFKSINDSYGHAIGDEVLQTVAQALQTAARESDYVARYGGEEFIAALPDTDADQCLATAERLRLAITRTVIKGICITASIGAATMDSDEADAPPRKAFTALRAQADQALYVAKRNGRNQSRHFLQIKLE